jgi:hypothetical protein
VGRFSGAKVSGVVSGFYQRHYHHGIYHVTALADIMVAAQT